MPSGDWPGFLAVATAAYLVPGPDFAVIVRASADGRARGLAASAGAQSGLLVHALGAVLGLSLVLARSEAALRAIQLAGGLYLAYLGLRAVTDAGAAHRRDGGAATAADRHALGSWYLRGVLTNLLNPKALLFFVSVLPQFVDRGAPLAPQIALFGAADILLGAPVWVMVVLGASRIQDRLVDPVWRIRWDRATGAIFLVVAFALVTAHV